MIRFRRGNVPGLGRDVGCELRDDRAARRDDRVGQPAWARGCRTACPEPMTATVVPPAWTAAACAAPSIPTARPDTTLAPTSTRVGGDPGGDRPARVGRRGASRRWRPPARTLIAAGSPRTYRRCGGISMRAEAGRVRRDPRPSRPASPRSRMRSSVSPRRSGRPPRSQSASVRRAGARSACPAASRPSCRRRRGQARRDRRARRPRAGSRRRSRSGAAGRPETRPDRGRDAGEDRPGVAFSAAGARRPSRRPGWSGRRRRAIEPGP